MCDYKFEDGTQCKETRLPGSKYCILHTPFPEDRDSEEFKRIAKLKEEKVEEKIKKWDFNFEGAILLNVDFSGTTIKGDVNFINAIILENALFGLNDVSSDNASFGESIAKILEHYKAAIIKGNVKFSGAKIGGDVLFGKTTIKGNVSFEKAEIKGNVKFDWDAIIGGDLSFENAEIGGNAFFSEANIKGNAFLNNVVICGAANFVEITIGRNLELGLTTIDGPLMLKRAKIGKDIWLSGTVKGKLGFEEAIIRGNAHLSSTKVKNNMWAEKATIEKNAYFSGIIAENAWCSGITVKGDLIFNRAYIEEDASFFESNIKGNVNFERTVVKGKLEFDKAEIGGNAWFSTLNVQGRFSLEETVFEKPKAEGNACRVARHSYEKFGDRETADYYFLREMRARRKQKNKIAQFFEWWIADFTCQYGTNFIRPVAIWFILVIIVFPCIYYFGHGITLSSLFFHSTEKSFASAEYFSIVTATTLGYGDLQPALTTLWHIPIFRAIASAEAIFGTFMWVIFLTVFARKYMR